MACTVLTDLVYLPVWVLFRLDEMLRVDVSELLIQGGFQSMVPGILAFYVMTLATRTIGANMTALFFALIPVASAGLAVVILGEELTASILMGLFLTTLGIVLSSIDGRQVRARQTGVEPLAS